MEFKRNSRSFIHNFSLLIITSSLISIQGSVDYFIEKSNAPDLIIPVIDTGNNKEMDTWLEKSENIKEYEIDESILINYKNIERNNKSEEYIAFGDILLEAQPKKLGKVLTSEGEEVFLDKGEIAFCIADKINNNLEIGDEITVTIGEVNKSFKIKTFTKDSLYGSAMSEMKRILISEEDYKEIKETSSDKTIFRNYYINSDNIEEVKKEFKGVDISYMTMIDKSMLNTTFILEMLPSIILILVSLCLIIIACLILRFTIVFTIQDDFKEIGIMKAIGLRSCAIKKIFLIKYFIISLIGVVIGGGISIPIGEALLKKSAAGMLMEPSENGWILNLVSGIGIILIPLLSLI